MCFEYFEKLQNQRISMITLWKSNDFELSSNLLGKFLPQKPTFYDIKKTKIFFRRMSLSNFLFPLFTMIFGLCFKWIFFMWTFLIIIEPHLSFSCWILVLIHIRWFMKSCCFFVSGPILHSLPLKYLNIWKYTLLASYIWSVFLEKFYLICVKYLQCIESIINFAYFCCVWK